MNNEKILVYPHDRTFQTVMDCERFWEREGVCKPAALISPRGWEALGDEDFDAAIEVCDTVLFRDAVFPVDFYKLLLPKIKIAVEKKKKVVFCRRKKEEVEQVRQLVPGEQLTIEKSDQREIAAAWEKQIYDIHVPVAFVCGMAEDTYKQQTGLLLASAFRKKGYRVSCLCSNAEMAYFGERIWPSLVYENIAADQKILGMNHFVHTVEVEDKPDIMILVIPGGFMEISKKCVGDFGVMAYEVGKAVRPDFVILNTIMGNMGDELCQALSGELEKVIGKRVDLFNCVPVLLQMQESNESHEPELLYVDDEYIEKELRDAGGEQVVHIYHEKGADDAVDQIIERLS